MNTTTTATLGMLFALLGFAATFLMYHLWGYPFDKENNKSSAPAWLMYLHRMLGYAFAVCYVLMMWQMLPRLWEYQVEFPARTVAHVLLGFTVGFILLIKISIMRFFRHFEEWMPYLGTGLLFCTVLLVALSLPAAAQERALADRAFSPDNIARVNRILPRAGLPTEAPLVELTSSESLARGRWVLLRQCVRCHDLKTILRKPRTPIDWYRTVERMADKPALFDPIEEMDRWKVTTYLVAITPDLQRASKRLRRAKREKERALEAAKETAAAGDTAAPLKTFDMAVATKVYRESCAQCHALTEVADNPPNSRAAIDALTERMIGNGLDLEKEQIEQVKFYLFERYVKK